MLLIHHLRKRARSGRAAAAVRVAADDLRGSSHISAAARSVMALSVAGVAASTTPGGAPVSGVPPAQAGAGPEVDGAEPASVQPDVSEAHPVPAEAGSRFDGPRRLEIVKTNLCRHPPPLAVVFEGENVAVPTLRYSEFVEPAPQPSQTDLCGRWILAFLADAGEPVRPADVVRAAGEEGFSRMTVYRARRTLGEAVVELGKNAHDPHKRWALPVDPTDPKGFGNP